MKFSKYYLIHIQYLGFRFHGWAKQPQVKTVQHMIEKTLAYVLGHRAFRVLGCSRTDAMVSAEHMIFELFLKEGSVEPASFLNDLRSNLPPDINALDIEEVDADFNVIQGVKLKTYIYLFSIDERPHPFASSLISYAGEGLDIALMKDAAKCYKGIHCFKNYCIKPGEGADLERNIVEAEIVPNTFYTASFFPKASYAFRVTASGFLRQQVRMMVGQLFALGKSSITMAQFERSLKSEAEEVQAPVAPASGLILYQVHYSK